ncbi:MAG TPA: hypothetical protein VLA04_05585, partial [Verrucomicrobiae bacterium]|nr:hypothetical protein [Verrucomicrobiae bacterium]
EKTHSFKATGSKDVGEKATGTVTFSNSSTTNKLTIPEGTTITAGGKTFVTNAAAIVDGLTISGGKITPGSGSSPITATEAGAGSNMSNTLGNNVAVGKDSVSTVVTASGGSSKTVTVVSSQDLVDAKAELVKQLTDDVKVKLADLLANRTLTFKADSDKLEMGDVSSTVPVGAEAEGGEVKGSASIRRTVVETSKLDNAISDRLRGEQLTTKSYQVTSKEITVATQSEDGKLMTLSAKLAGKEAPIVPIEEFPALLSGKSFAAGEKLIEDQVPTATTATTQRPGWWPIKRHPSVNRYILIDLKYE